MNSQRDVSKEEKSDHTMLSGLEMEKKKKILVMEVVDSLVNFNFKGHVIYG